jgi:hypothetical protein
LAVFKKNSIDLQLSCALNCERVYFDQYICTRSKKIFLPTDRPYFLAYVTGNIDIFLGLIAAPPIFCFSFVVHVGSSNCFKFSVDLFLFYFSFVEHVSPALLVTIHNSQDFQRGIWLCTTQISYDELEAERSIIDAVLQSPPPPTPSETNTIEHRPIEPLKTWSASTRDSVETKTHLLKGFNFWRYS